MRKTNTHSKRYGFAFEYIEAIISWFPEVSNRKSWLESFGFTPNWGDATKIYYDPKKDKFIANFLIGYRTIPDSDVFAAIKLVNEKLNIESVKEQLLEEYADALNYFYNNPMIDDKGLFVKEGIFGKKYFTNAELDDLKEKYLKKIKSKV